MHEHEYAEHCEEIRTHQDIVDRVKPEMPDEESLYDLAELFKVFGIRQGSGSCTCCSRRKCASAISRSF